MKGVFGFLGMALVIYLFWVTWEYFRNKNKLNSNNKNQEKNER